MLDDVTLYHGDCLQEMDRIEDGSIDLILTDLPYGTVGFSWDVVIPFVPLWEQYRRILKPTGVIALTASQPFTSVLVMSNLAWFKYEWIWRKTMCAGFIHAKNAPLKAHESILIFSPAAIAHKHMSKRRMPYFPQMRQGKPYQKYMSMSRLKWGAMQRPSMKPYVMENSGERYPISVLDIPNPNSGSLHPTQKPVALMEYLILTYTSEGETVLDSTMGSGTTGVAAIQTGRRFVGIERDETIFCVAQARIASVRKV